MRQPRRYELRDEQRQQIGGHFPKHRTGHPTTLDNRTAFNAILWIARSGGAAW